MDNKVQGTLVIIGGAEDREGKCEILRKVVELAGKRDTNLVIMTAATEMPEVVGEDYRRIFKRLGAENTTVLNISTREEANDSRAIKCIDEATGIFFTGGDQLRITSLLGGTGGYEKLHEAYKRGVVIAGTSAGASVMSSTMIVEGDSERAPHKNTLKMAPGMGLINGVVVDQHFAQRGRLGRLLTAVAQNPYVLGIGIDEDTAMVVSPNGQFKVFGSQTVTVVDGEDITTTNVSESKPDEFLTMTNVRLHVLAAGYGYDLGKRTPLL